jgi:hypothetical protein
VRDPDLWNMIDALSVAGERTFRERYGERHGGLGHKQWAKRNEC